jgi:hypothetical protein
MFPCNKQTQGSEDEAMRLKGSGWGQILRGSGVYESARQVSTLLQM